MGGGWATAFTAPERIRAVRDVRAHASRRYGWTPTAGQLKSDATEQIHLAGGQGGLVRAGAVGGCYPTMSAARLSKAAVHPASAWSRPTG